MKGRSIGGTILKVIGGLFVALIAIIVLVAMFSDSHPSNSAQVAAPPPPKPASFQVIAHSQRDDECTQIGDYCMRVHCTYVNGGEIAGDKQVGARLFDRGESVAIRQGSLTLLPNNSKEYYFDFPEAELGDEHSYTSQCLVQD